MRIELLNYKDASQIEGKFFRFVPATWSVKRLKFVMPEENVGIVITPSKYYVDKGVPAIRSLNVRKGKLTDNDWQMIAGKEDQLIGKIQERYGMARDQAQRDVDDFVRTMPAEDFPTTPAEPSGAPGRARGAGQH